MEPIHCRIPRVACTAKKVSSAQQKAIELESKEYELIGNQLYKRGKDKQLRLCVTEAEYVKVLKQAHAGLLVGLLAGLLAP